MNNTTTPLSWVGEPDGRETWTILSTCMLTIVLCCWKSVSPNVPAKSDRYWSALRDKLHLACIRILGPESLLVLAMGQWASARKPVKTSFAFRDQIAFTRLNSAVHKGEWTMIHAFYADMGGFLLHGPGIKASFPIDRTQLLFLVQHGYLECPDIPRKDLENRNESDGFTRCILICQAVWQLLNCVLRVYQGLALMTLELTTIFFILILLATSSCWYYKPQDIATTINLTLKADINSIRNKDCPSELGEWDTNPLDFLHPRFHIFHILWHYYNQILLRIRCPIFSRLVIARPCYRIPNDIFHLDTLAEAITAPIVLIFGSLFMCAWHFHFPSSAEQLLWRISSTYTLLFTIIGGLYVRLCYKILVPLHIEEQKSRTLSDVEKAAPTQSRRMQLQQRLTARIRNIHLSRDPIYNLPLAGFWTHTLLDYEAYRSRLFRR